MKISYKTNIILLILIWFYGISVGKYKIFPYKSLKKIQDKIPDELYRLPSDPYSIENRYSITSDKIHKTINRELKTLIF